jgi:hypothetical protein
MALVSERPARHTEEPEMTATTAAARHFGPAQLFVLFAILLTLVTGATVAAAQSFASAGSGHSTGEPVNPRCMGC